MSNSSLTLDYTGTPFNSLHEFLQGVLYSYEPKPLIPVLSSNTSSVIYSTQYSDSYAAYFAFDDNNSTIWGTKDGAWNGAFIGYVFNSPRCVKKVVIHHRNDAYALKNYKLQYSDDGVTWNDLASLTNTLGSDRTTEHEIDNKNYHKWYRILCTSNYGATGTGLRGLQFYGI